MTEEEQFDYQRQQANINQISNRDYINATALQFRLDTDVVLDRIEYFLRGSRYIVNENGVQKITVGKPKANELGIQSILNYLSATINPQVVQGNFGRFEDGRYDDYMYNLHYSFATLVVANCYNWQIRDEDIDLIIDFCLNLIEPFMTRLIDNKERESYALTMRSLESNTLQQQQKPMGFGFFRRRE